MKTKKTAAIISAAILALSAASISYAEDIGTYPVEGGNLYYDKDRGVATNIDLYVKNIVIPSEIDGVKIKGIDFDNLPYLPSDGRDTITFLETVVIQDGIEYIDENSFRESNALKSIIIPDSVTSIGKGTFDECNELVNVRLPQNLTRIEDYTFSYCFSLKNITIPDSVTYIGEGAFNGSAIENITLPKYIKEISPNTFCRCEHLININIPYGVTSIGDWAFNGCKLKTVDIPNTVTSLGNYAFYDSNITTLKIPSSVKYIGENAFNNYDEFKTKLIVEPGSYALQYAIDNGYPYEIYNPITVTLNGAKLTFDREPFIENGTTYVPMRAIFEAMGASVDWNQAAQTVTAKKGSTSISLTINNSKASVNGSIVSMTAVPKLVNGSTMVPLRFVGESLGAKVDWNGTSRTITING